MNQNKVSFNFKEIYLGGGSPTYYKEEEFKYLIKNEIAYRFFKIGDFTIEVDPRRVDEERLMFYHEQGVTRLSLVFKILIEMFKKKLIEFNHLNCR